MFLSRITLFVALVVATPGLSFAIYKTTSTPSFLLTEKHQLAAPIVTTTPLAPQRETVLIGNGDEEDPCTVQIAVSALPEMEKIGIRKWVTGCEAARAAAND